MERILITGVTGLAGRHLAERLGGSAMLVGAARNAGRVKLDDPLRAYLDPRELDIRNEAAIIAMLADVQPQVIYHMAAVVPIAIALETPAEPLTTNVVGTANLFQAIRKTGLRSRIVVSGSSEEYGLIHPDEVPVTEDQPLRPSNPYAVSKVAQTLLARQFHRSYGLDVVVGRAFNLTGAGQNPLYACPAFAQQLARIEGGLEKPVVRVGNLSPRRDYSDVRDIVEGYVLLASHGAPGQVYNICGGTAISMREILDTLLAELSVPVRVEVDPSRVRPAENDLIIGDNRRIAALGYRPQFTMDQTLRDLLAYWRGQVRREGIG